MRCSPLHRPSNGNPLGSPDPQTFSPDNHRDRQQSKDTHQHTEDAEWLRITTVMDPCTNKEGPCKRDNSPDASDCDKAVSCDASIRLDEVVEANRRCLHETERHHGKTDLQANPASRRGVIRDESEHEGAYCSNRECRKSSNKTRFRLRETMAIFLRETLSRPISGQVRVDLEATC
jgi:hypothetical protein